jgi:cullin 1
MAMMAPPIPRANADLQTTWAYLEEGIDHIMDHPRDGISYKWYMNLYTVAMNYCMSSRMHGILDSSVGLGGRSESFGNLRATFVWTNGYIVPPAGASLMGSDLYNNLIRYFVGYLSELRDVRISSLWLIYSRNACPLS